LLNRFRGKPAPKFEYPLLHNNLPTLAMLAFYCGGDTGLVLHRYPVRISADLWLSLLRSCMIFFILTKKKKKGQDSKL